MIKKTYTLTTGHQSFSHLYDTQFMRYVFILRNMASSSERESSSLFYWRDGVATLLGDTVFQLQIAGSVLISLMIVAPDELNAVTVNGPTAYYWQQSYGNAPTSSPGDIVTAHPDRGPQALRFGLSDDDLSFSLDSP